MEAHVCVYTNVKMSSDFRVLFSEEKAAKHKWSAVVKL